MLRRLQHEKQNRNSFCLCEITLRTLRFKKSVNLRLIQNRYTPKVPSRGQSLLTTFAYILSIRKISFSLFQLSQHNPMQENLGVALRPER